MLSENSACEVITLQIREGSQKLQPTFKTGVNSNPRLVAENLKLYQTMSDTEQQQERLLTIGLST